MQLQFTFYICTYVNIILCSYNLLATYVEYAKYCVEYYMLEYAKINILKSISETMQYKS